MKKFITFIAISAFCSLPCSSQYTTTRYDLSCHATGMTVYVTPNGEKYHKKSCRTLSRSKEVNSMDIDKAKAKGYTACKVCF